MTRFTARILTPSERTSWDALYARSEGYLAQDWDYLDLASTGIGRPVRIGIFSNGDNLIGGLGFTERRRHFVTQWRHAAPLPFGGLLRSKEDTGESFLRDVLTAAGSFIRTRVAVAEIIMQPTLTDVRGLLWHGWSARPHYNYFSKVSAESPLSAQAENSVRRQAKSAEEAGLLYRQQNEITPSLKMLYEATTQRQGFEKWVEWDAFTALFNHYQAKQAALVATVGTETNLSAGAIFLGDSTRLYYTLGASTREGGEGAPSLLHLETTKRCVEEQGACGYDWCGANSPTVAQFKKKFRPTLEVYQRCFWLSRIGRFSL